MNKTIELKMEDNTFSDMYVYQILAGLFKNGYSMTINPAKYPNGTYTLMIDICGIDDSFIPQPTEESR